MTDLPMLESESWPEWEPTCQTCRFWEPDAGMDSGLCHRFPPQLSERALRLGAQEAGAGEADEEGLLRAARRPGAWLRPCTSADGWCGEWQPLGQHAADSRAEVHGGACRRG